VLIAAVPPVLVKSPTNPGGLPIEVFDGIRSSLASDRAQFYKEFAVPFYGVNRPGATVSQGIMDQFFLSCMQVGLRNSYECVRAFSETEFHDDLEAFDVPTLLMHGEDDQIVPIDISSRKSATLIKGAVELYYPGLPHGLTATHADLVNRDLLAFCRQGARKVA
jgi:non-heme chloroperoxidase